jgi:hypothetical protein
MATILEQLAAARAAHFASGNVSVSERLSKWTAEELNVVVSVEASNQSGNCPPGSSGWAETHLGRTSATVREVLTAAYATGDRVPQAEAACRYACSQARG